MQQLNILDDIEENEVIENNTWETFKLSEIIEIIGGGTPKTDNAEYWNGNIPWLSVVDFNNDNRKVYSTEKTITDEGLKKSSTKLLKEGQIIISARGTVGELAQLGRDMAFNQSCYGLNAKEKLTNDFLYYLLKYNILNVKNNTHGAVFDTITKQTFDHIIVNIPELKQQVQIAKILSSLDDKIELNQKMNKTLEEMAQAIFKHWFIDFEFPNEEGKPYKSSGGEMVDSELGDIPNSWISEKFSELVDISSGKSIKRGEFISDDGYPIIGANGEIGRASKYLIDEEVFLTGRVGTLGTVFLINEKIWPSDNVLISKSKNYYYYYYSYFTMKRFDFRSLNRGSTQPLITQSDIKNQNIIIPKSDILIEFDKILRSIFSKIRLNTKQIIELTKIRDSLLPKLMSGEIRTNSSPNPRVVSCYKYIIY